MKYLFYTLFLSGMLALQSCKTTQHQNTPLDPPYLLSGRVIATAYSAKYELLGETPNRIRYKIYKADGKSNNFTYISSKHEDTLGNEQIYTELDIRGWLDENHLIAAKSINHITKGIMNHNIVILDTLGNEIQQLTNYKTVRPHAINFYINWVISDKKGRKILYELADWKSNGINKSNKLDTYLYIINLKTKEIELEVKNFGKKGGKSHGPYFTENSFSPDGKQFVYIISAEPQKDRFGDKIHDNDTIVGGAYIYDIAEKKDVYHIRGATKARWNPEQNIIAYTKDKNIWLYYVDTKQHKCFLKSTIETLRIQDFHWNPEGDHIYVQCYFNRKWDEKLFRIKDGEEVIFRKLGLRGTYYFWK